LRQIFHIARQSDWQRSLTDGTYRVSTLGRSLEDEGFIHCSERHQVAGVANAFYRGVPGLVLLVIDADRVGPDVKDEALDGGAERFPHIYGPLNVDAVVVVEPLEPGEDGVFSPLS
jgi:glutathione S-transferase